MRLRWICIPFIAAGLSFAFQPNEVERAKVLLQQRQYKDAAAAFERALKASPKDLDAQIGLGIALWGSGKREAALAAFRRASELNPSSPQAHYNVALAMQDAGELKQAVAEINLALKLKPDYEEACLALGLLLQRQGDVAGAMSQYRAVLKRNPASAEAHNWLGVAYLEKNAYTEAVAEFKEAIRLQPSLVRAHNNLGSTLVQTGDLNSGIQAFEAGLKQAPGDLQIHLNLAIALRNRGDADAALAHFEAILKTTSDNPNVLLAYGQTLRQKGDLPAAIQAFESAVRIDPESRESYYALGQALRQSAPQRPPAQNPYLKQGYDALARKDLAAAKAAFSQAVDADSQNAEARYNFGVALFYGGDKSGSAVQLEEALRLNPAAADASNFRGMLYAESGNLDAAQRFYQRALALNPDLPYPYIDLARLFLRQDRLERALGMFEAGLNLPSPPPDLDASIEQLKQAVARNPQNAEAHIILARLLGAAGADPQKVIAEFQSAIRLQPGSAPAHNYLGLVFTQIGDDAKAIAEFREAVRIQPNYADAHANLGAVLTSTDVAASIRELQRAIELQPDLVKAHFNLAVAYASSPVHGQEKEIEELLKVISLAPSMPRGHLALGRAYLRKGNVMDAITHLQRAVELDPKYGEARYQLGLALSRAGRQQESAVEIQKGRDLVAASQGAQNANLDLAEAKQALENGELDNAINKLRRVLASYPDSSEARSQLQAALIRKYEDDIRQGRFTDLEPRLEQFVKDFPDVSWGWYALGYTQFNLRKIGDAIKSLARSLQLDVGNADAHKTLGRALMIIGRFSEAQIEFEQALRCNPGSAEVNYNLAKLFSIQDNYPPARQAAEKAIQLAPDYMEAYDALGFALEALGDDASAVAAYEKAVAINERRGGSFAQPYVNLSTYHNRSGNPPQALEWARRALAVNPKADGALFQMAKALDAAGDREAALDAVQRAIAINSRSSSYYYVLATLCRRLGKQQESLEALDTFRRLEQESSELDKKRRESSRDD